MTNTFKKQLVLALEELKVACEGQSVYELKDKVDAVLWISYDNWDVEEPRAIVNETNLYFNVLEIFWERTISLKDAPYILHAATRLHEILTK